jgi:hypothetical protein
VGEETVGRVREMWRWDRGLRMGSEESVGRPRAHSDTTCSHYMQSTQAMI